MVNQTGYGPDNKVVYGGVDSDELPMQEGLSEAAPSAHFKLSLLQLPASVRSRDPGGVDLQVDTLDNFFLLMVALAGLGTGLVRIEHIPPERVVGDMPRDLGPPISFDVAPSSVVAALRSRRRVVLGMLEEHDLHLVNTPVGVFGVST